MYYIAKMNPNTINSYNALIKNKQTTTMSRSEKTRVMETEKGQAL